MSWFINANWSFGYKFSSTEPEIGRYFRRTAADCRFRSIHLLFKPIWLPALPWERLTGDLGTEQLCLLLLTLRKDLLTSCSTAHTAGLWGEAVSLVNLAAELGDPAGFWAVPYSLFLARLTVPDPEVCTGPGEVTLC